MKEEMSSFDIAALIPEINRIIEGAWIHNVYQINSTTILLRLRKKGHSPIYLVINAGKCLYVTSYYLKRPKKPPDFCMALRKYLKNGRVIELQQHEFERTVFLRVKREEEFQLVSELFGGGNIILVNPQNEVLHALVYRKMRDRKIWRKEIFQFAPPKGRNPLKLERQDLDEIKSFGKREIVRALTKFLSIGGLYAEEILLRARVEKITPCEELTEEDLDGIFNQLHQIISNITDGETQPGIVLDENDEWIDVTPIPLRKHFGLQRKKYRTFNEALDDYYTNVRVTDRVYDVTSKIDEEFARQKRVLKNQRRALNDLRDKMERSKRIGDVIYMHLNELQFLLQGITDKKMKGASWRQIASDMLEEKEAKKIPAIYFNSLDPERRTLEVNVENLTFSLDLRSSIQANAADYYKSSKRAERKLRGAKKALEKTQTNIMDIRRQEVEHAEEGLEPPSKRREKQWYEKFRWFHSSDGILIIGGRDASSNEILINRYMEPYDKVFHADIPGAPFVIIKTDGKTLSDQTISEAARLAASYSRAWKEKLGAVDVYWVSPEQVKKSPPSGQYLKRGSFIVSRPKNYVRNVQLQVAIGIKSEKEQLIIIGGPPEAIANQTSNYVEIVPGKQSSSRLAKRVQKLLSRKAPRENQKQILKIPLEEIQHFIPSGEGSLKMES